jgi:hypothetical protein
MDKIFFLSHRTTQAIERSQDFLNDLKLCGDLTKNNNLLSEGNVILGLNNEDSDNYGVEDVVFEESVPTED